jgi:phospholipase C
MPGPTWPNRFFLHAGSSGGLDHSPPKPRELGAITSVDGYSFQNGTIFDRLENKGVEWTIYHDDEFPQVLAIKGMIEYVPKHFERFDEFREDVNKPDFSKSYIFIEPNWHSINHFRCGNSQHPMDDVTRGERFLKDIYEIIRNSPHWESSLLIITYDEHGGFYDHIVPPTAIEPGDSITHPANDKFHFNFKQLGVRVPTIVVSPLIRKGIVDHRLYEHASVLSTLEKLFSLDNLTQRDRLAAPLNDLLSLSKPRDDCPKTLPKPAVSGVKCNLLTEFVSWIETYIGKSEDIDPALRGFVQIALLRELHDSSSKREELINKFSKIDGRNNAVKYMRRVRSTLT